jgi:nicotinate-nucleotide adenylyltransferase
LSRSIRIGLYGGTFDPIHNGHLYVVTELLERDVVDQIILVPAGEPWLRENEPSASGEDRLKMCQLAVAELDLGDEVFVNSIEIRRTGPSYTIDTVEALMATYPDDEIVLILGTDAHATIDQWHRSDELKKLVEVLVIDRPDFPGSPTLDIGALNISATEVRAGDSDLLPPAVVTYIKERGLYASK